MHDGAAARKFNGTAEGHHPVVAVVGIYKQILHMRGGKMQIFDPFVCVHKPALALWVHRRLQLGERLRCNHFAVVRKDRHAHQKIPVRLIEQPHIFGEAFHICIDIDIFDHAVIHRIRNAHHIVQVIIQVQIDLVQHAAVVIRNHLLVGVDKACRQDHRHQDHSGHCHQGKGDRNGKLEAAFFKGMFDFLREISQASQHHNPPKGMRLAA